MDKPFIDIAAAPSIAGAARRPTLTLDVALYEGYLADRDLDEAQKRALLESLWAIIVGFVDLGFAVEPAAKHLEGQDEAREEFASAGFDMLDFSANTATDHFEKAAAHCVSSGD